jgi:long-chain acyl-CoA synthetase
MRREWRSAADGRILGEAPQTLGALFSGAVERHSGAVAFVCDGAETTFGEAGERAAALAAFFQTELGIQKGDRVALMSPNTLAFPVSAIATVWAGAVLVNVNPRYTARELRHQLDDSGAETIIIDISALPVLSSVLPETRIRHVLVSTSDAGPTPEGADQLRDLEAVADRTLALELAIERGRSSEWKPPDVAPDDIAVLQYTGGTTGLSKGAVLRHRNIATNSAQVRTSLVPPLEVGSETILTALPLYHIFAFTVNFVTFFSLGAVNLLIRDAGDLDGLLARLQKRPISAMTGVNTLYAGIAAHPRAKQVDWSGLKVAIGGGSAILRITSERWKDVTGVHILEGYGMTETSPVLTVNPPSATHFTETVGRPLPETEIVIFDDGDQPVDVGCEGEICVRGPQVMSGYWNRDASQDDVFNPMGFLKTGDVGLLDEQGNLKIIDRKKDVILVSGFNVYPNEIEAVASAFPGIAECACVGTPDDCSGEAVVLYVVPEAKSAVDRDALRRFCREQLVAYKVPRSIQIVSDLPKSTVGKVLRRELRDA